MKVMICDTNDTDCWSIDTGRTIYQLLDNAGAAEFVTTGRRYSCDSGKKQWGTKAEINVDNLNFRFNVLDMPPMS